MTKAGAGTVTLGAVNAYTGQTTVNQGSLTVATGVNNVFNGTTGTAVQVNSGGTLNIGSTTQSITTLGLTGNGVVSGASGTLNLGGDVTYDASNNPAAGATVSATTLNLNGTRTFNIGQSSLEENVNSNTTGMRGLTISSGVVNGSVSGSGITKNGPGILLLSALSTANTYTGPTTVNAGTLYFLNTSSGTAAPVRQIRTLPSIPVRRLPLRVRPAYP